MSLSPKGNQPKRYDGDYLLKLIIMEEKLYQSF